MPEIVNAAALAKKLGVSRQAIGKAVATGRLVPLHQDSAGRMVFDLDTAKTAWDNRPNQKITNQAENGNANAVEAHHTLAKGKQGNDNKGMSSYQKLVAARASREVFSAGIKHFELRERQKKSISVDLVRKQGEELGAILMGAICALPARLSPTLSTMSNQGDIYEYLENELNFMIVAVRRACGVDKNDDESENDERTDTSGE